MSSQATIRPNPKTQEMNPQQAIVFAQQLVRENKLQDAANICYQLSEKLPDFAPADLLMSDIHLVTGNIDAAKEFADRAVAKDPAFTVAKLQHIKILEQQGQHDQMQSVIDELAKAEPDNPLLLGTRADILLKSGKPDQALAVLEPLIAKQPLALLKEQKALCLANLQRRDDALAVLKQLDESGEITASGCMSYAKLLLADEATDEMDRLVKKATQLDPMNADAWRMVAIFAYKAGRKDEAILHAMRSVQLDPKMVHSYVVLCNALMDRNRHGEAERAIRAGLEQVPGSIALEDALRDLLVVMGRKEEALEYLEKGLARDPDNPVLKHYAAAMRGQATETAPSDYVAALFDQYAGHFDEHLQEGLQYRTPQKLAGVIREIWVKQNSPTTGLSLLDLGCGTGLAAEALKDHTTQRVGIDLSEKMIEKAKSKGLYQEAIAGDMMAFIASDARQYDLAVAADVFVYVGRLDTLFKELKRVLKPNGLFAFSVEDGDDNPPYILQPTGRYAHSRAYIEALADDHGYTVQSHKQEEIRKDRGKPIMGHLYILQPKAH